MGEAKQNKIGRPTGYTPELCDVMLEYFDIPATRIVEINGKEEVWSNTLPTVSGFCRQQRISRETFYRWVEQYEEFRDTYKVCKDIMEDIWVENSINGRYNTAFTIFAGKNIFGWTDKQEIKANVDTNKMEDLISQFK